LKWVDRGASLYVTLGLFATPNSPGVIHALKDGKDIPRKIDFDTITVPETGKALLFPTQWKVTPEMNEIKKEIIIKRNEILKGLFQAHGVKMPIPIESYVTVALLANQFGTSGYQIHADMMKKIESYTAKHIHTQYVSI
jgi:hypothetical protein